ncbi:hypothetical protein [Mesorhizobium escarrei]|nr:hypothetical protein [Mesorhizobium escarrei]
MMQFSPALLGCYIWDGTVAILPSAKAAMRDQRAHLDQVVAIGNSHAEQGDTFAATGLTPGKAQRPRRRSSTNGYASFECRLFDDRMVDEYGFFIGERQSACGANRYTADTPQSRPGILHGGGKGGRLSKAVQV